MVVNHQREESGFGRGERGEGEEGKEEEREVGGCEGFVRELMSGQCVFPHDLPSNILLFKY